MAIKFDRFTINLINILLSVYTGYNNYDALRV